MGRCKVLLWHTCPKPQRKAKRGDNDEDLELRRSDTLNGDGRFLSFTLIVLRNKWRQIEQILCLGAGEMCRMGCDNQRGLPPAPVCVV